MMKNTLLVLSAVFMGLAARGQDYYQKTFSNASYTDVQELANGELFVVGQVAKMIPGSAIVQKLSASGELLTSEQLTAGGGSGLNFFGGLPNHTITMDGDNVLLSVYSSGFTGNTSVYPGLLKMNASGDVLWNKVYKNDALAPGGVNARGGTTSTIIDNGNYVSTGWFNSGSGGAFDYFNLLQKTDADGNVIWRKDFGYAFIFASDLTKAANGNYVVLGGQSGGLYLYLFTEDGNYIEHRRYGIGTVYPVANQILNTADGGYLIVGTAAYMDGYVLKLNADYSVAWSKRYTDGTKVETFNKVVATTDGGYLIAGDVKENLSAGGDGLLLKIDSEGVIEWSKTYGRATDDSLYGLKATSDGYLAVGGSGTDGWILHTDLEGNANGCDEFEGAITAMDATTTATLQAALATPGSTTGVLDEPITKSAYDASQVLPYAIAINAESTSVCNGELLKLELALPQATAVWSGDGDGQIFTDAQGMIAYDGAEKLHTVYVAPTTSQIYTAEACLLTDTIAINANTTAAPSGNVQQELCQGATLEDIEITGNAILWYDAATEGNALPATSVLENNITYYASQTADCGESGQRLGVAVTLVSLAAPEGEQVQVFCTSAFVTDLQVTGMAIKWYSQEVGGEALAENTALTDQTIYYASQTNACGESIQRLAVTVAVTITAAPQGEATQSSCSVETLADIIVAGNAIIWYDSVSSDTVLTDTTEVTEGTTYYASQTVDGCESVGRLAVTIEACLGLDNNVIGVATVYPNPVKDIITIQATQDVSELNIYSLTGQVIRSSIPSGTNVELSISDFPSGIYLLVVTAGDKKQSFRIIKQ